MSRRTTYRLPSVSADTVGGTPSVFTRTVLWPDSRTRRRRITTTSPEPYQPGSNQPYLEDDEWEAAFVLYDRTGRGAETSSGRHWSETAFIAVGARSWLRPRLRTRTISNLSTALPTSQWRTTWTTSRRCVCVVTSSRLRGNNESRIIWKAGCLETCTSGLGLGPG